MGRLVREISHSKWFFDLGFWLGFKVLKFWKVYDPLVEFTNKPIYRLFARMGCFVYGFQGSEISHVLLSKEDHLAA
jgi:hypothetical protein